MWSGEVQGGYPTQWALNPSAYQNLPNEQVDWATLAQQWIKMKETFPLDQVPPAPPPPSIKEDIEAGEAPMDMSKDDVIPNSTSASRPQDGSNWGNWNNWQQWGWNWQGPPGAASAAVPPEKVAAPMPPYTFSSSTAPTYPTSDAPATFDYNHGAPVANSFDQQEYWTESQPPYIRSKNTDWRDEQRSSSSSRRPDVPKVEEIEPDTTALFDAAKRKQLPAWIREGLEKMEREKQKKLDRERQLREREEEIMRRNQLEEEALASGIPLKSKFDTDSEESDKEVEEPPVKVKRSRFDTASPVPVKPIVTRSSPPPQIPVKRKSREEMMQEVMQQVRYTLTNILMKVTNEEMQRIAEEVYADFRTKGLGIYDSDSEDSAESDSEAAGKQKNGVDSDEELRERIHRKRQEFARVERDIEHQVELQEEREREREHRYQESEEEPERETEDKGQVEPKATHPGLRPDVKVEEPKAIVETKAEENHTEFYTPERPYKESSVDPSEDSDKSSSKSSSTSRSSSSSRYKKSRKSSKKKKEKKNTKKRRKRSSSRGSDYKKSSHKKSSRKYEERRRHERSRSRSRSHHDEYRRKRRHSSESSHRRKSSHHSYSPDYSRGKKSSHRSRD